jgi:hypothetical protein
MLSALEQEWGTESAVLPEDTSVAAQASLNGIIAAGFTGVAFGTVTRLNTACV